MPHHAKANAPLQFSVLDGNLEVDLSPGYFEMRIKDLLVKRKQLTIQAIVFESPAGGSQPRSQGFSVRTRRDTRKPWSGPVTCLPKKWQYLTATRQGVARYLMKYTSLRNK